MAGILDGVDQRTQLAGQNRLELLLFRLHPPQRFAINVFKVQEVIQCPELTQIPSSHPAVKGIANMRGKTITVMDLSMAIGEPPLDQTAGSFVIITEYNRRVQGFMVGSVDRIVNMTWGEIMPPPKGAAADTYMTAVTRVDDELVQIIDVEKVMKEIMGGSDTVSEGIINVDLMNESERILVADDSSVARNQVKHVLEQLGIGAILCDDGQQALEQLQAWADEGIDLNDYLSLIIADVEMPRMDGYTLTTEIRKDPRMADLHVILHTSLSGNFNQSMVKKVGANQFLPKYEPDELARVIQDQLRERKEKRQGSA